MGMDYDEFLTQLYTTAKQQTLNTLSQFLAGLFDVHHDNNTITNVYTAAIIAAFAAMDSHPQGNINKFQLEWVMRDVLQHVFEKTPPFRVIEYTQLLEPQMGHLFRILPEPIWKWTQEEAQRRVNDPEADPYSVEYQHWQQILDGDVPFGLAVVEKINTGFEFE